MRHFKRMLSALAKVQFPSLNLRVVGILKNKIKQMVIGDAVSWLFKPIFFLTFFLVFISCGEEYSPKPRGYFRIGLPEKKYTLYNPTDCPYSFDIPEYGKIVPYNSRYNERCWINLDFPRFNGEINLSYKSVNNNINKFIEDSRTLVYKHTVKANAINEKLINIPEHHVYGLLYEIGGDAASSVQFFVTDSTTHFLRGALYFNVPPRSDSLAPVIEFIKKDIGHLITSLQWKDSMK